MLNEKNNGKVKNKKGSEEVLRIRLGWEVITAPTCEITPRRHQTPLTTGTNSEIYHYTMWFYEKIVNPFISEDWCINARVNM